MKKFALLFLFSAGALAAPTTIPNPMQVYATNTLCSQALSIAFTGDTDTGLQRSAAGQVDACIDGVTALRLGTAITATSQLIAGSTSSDFILNTTTTRSAGLLFEIKNNGTSKFSVSPDGVIAGTVLTLGGSNSWQSFGGAMYTAGAARIDSGITQGGVCGSWGSTGFLALACSYHARLFQQSTAMVASGFPATVGSVADAAGEIGARVGSLDTDAAGGDDANLLTVATDIDGTPVDKFRFTGMSALLAAETTAPTEVSGFGSLYVKSSDSNLYFKSDGGVETALTPGGTFAGGTLTSSLVLDTTNTLCNQALSLAFAGDTDSGIQRAAADTWGLCAGATLALSLTATTVTVPVALAVTGATTLNGNTTIGNESGDSLTIHPAAWSMPNNTTITQSNLASPLTLLSNRAGGVDILALKNSNSGGTANAGFTVYNNSDNYINAGIFSSGYSTSGLQVANQAFVVTPTGTVGGLLLSAEAGPLILSNGATAAADERVRITDAEVAINDASQNVDLRAEGSGTRPDLFLVDAGTARVGINRAAGTHGATLDVDNLAVAEAALIVRDNGTAVVTVADGGNTTFAQNVAVTGTVAIGSGGTAISKHLSASASLNFGGTAAGSCDDLTIAVSGAADGDTTSCGIPTALMGSEYATIQCFVSAADVVTVRRCNLDNTLNALADAAAATVRVDVWKH